MPTRKPAGGAATAGGMNFQYRVTAWVAVRILAEKELSLPWDLPEGTTLEWLRCETEQPVDDLMVKTSEDGFVFSQIKRSLNLSEGVESDFAAALNQFVRQFVAYRASSSGKRPWERPLDPAQDRLVLIIGPNSSIPIRVHVPAVLERLRGLAKEQSLEDAAANNPEQKALAVIVSHIRRAWQAALASSPTDHEMRRLLSLIRVQVLDIDNGGDAEQNALDGLRSAVLRHPEQATTAWASLIAACARFAAGRSGADRHEFQRVLLDAGIEVQAPRSYRSDIARLRAYSQRTADFLTNLACIRVNATEIKIRRHSTEELRRIAEEDSLLVIGEPGAGKSGALSDLVRALGDEGRDIVFIVVDQLAACSLGELREELRLDRELPEILTNWPGTAPAFLVVDALDAARAELVARTIRDLIQTVVAQGDRWHVVASIRKFDLRYGPELQHLFTGEPSIAFRDPDFPRIRHLNIPQLSDEEFTQISSQSPALWKLINDVPGALRELLRIPFNLRLMAELLGAEMRPADLTPIRTQLELLDRYWSYQVLRSDGQRHAREMVLRHACNEMVRSRTLRIDQACFTDLATSVPLTDLLSTQVLTEWRPSPTGPPDRYVLTFAHHVLFDYAVERLLLRGTPESLVKRLVDDPELVIVVRPSLLLHFRHLWTIDSHRKQFWHVVFQILRMDSIRELGKLIGPAVAAELAGELSDLEPLCTAIESIAPETYTVADQALRHLIGALLAAPPVQRPLVGPEAGPWCDLLERVSRHLRTPVAYTVRSLLSTLCERPEIFSFAQRASTGKTAHQLLEFAWVQVPRDQWLVIHALQAVCRTFESDPSASEELLRRTLEPAHLAAHGYEEMPYLVREVKRLIPLDPVLVEDIYRAVFAYQEPSSEPTSIGHSRILPMSSNRQQDYQMAWYELAEVFPEFLVHAPQQAARAVIAVMKSYVAHQHTYASNKVIEESFDFNDEEARLQDDYSRIWDEGDTYRDDYALKLLGSFEEYVASLAEREDCREELRALVEVLVRGNRLAVLWRRLLLLGARFPSTLGSELLPLAWSIPILTGYNTIAPVGEFLKAIFPQLPPDKREHIERTLLSIPDAVPSDRREAGEHIRNRLLGCLVEDDLVSDEARYLLADLHAANAIPPNEPPVSLSVWSEQPFGEKEYLARQSVPVDAVANQRLRDLERPIQEFADKNLNAISASEEVAAILPALQMLQLALLRADDDGVHPEQQIFAWDCLTRACSRIVRMEGFSCEDPVGMFTRTALLAASFHPDPTHNPKYDAQFDEHLGWGSPAVRIGAVEGLIVLARHATCITTEVLQAVERLSTDPVPAARFQIAVQLNLLYRTAPDLMWRIVEHLCREESSRGVLQGLLSGALGRLAGAHPDQVAGLTTIIFDRIREGPGASKVRQLCINIFTLLYIWRDHTVCREIVFDIVANPVTNPDDAQDVLRHLREPLTYRSEHPSDPQQDVVRQRAFDLVKRLLRSAHEGLRDALSEPARQRAQALARLIDYIGTQIYFASGAFDDKQQGEGSGERRFTDEGKKRFCYEAGPILDELADVGLAPLAHHLLETLEMFISFDPIGVFLRIGRVVQGGKKDSYQYESLAVDLMVRLVERYLAEHRALLRENGECRQTLLEILDTFVQAGWRSARRLTYRLEEIFR